jgi:hypothetical protein
MKELTMGWTCSLSGRHYNRYGTLWQYLETQRRIKGNSVLYTSRSLIVVFYIVVTALCKKERITLPNGNQVKLFVSKIKRRKTLRTVYCTCGQNYNQLRGATNRTFITAFTTARH